MRRYFPLYFAAFSIMGLSILFSLTQGSMGFSFSALFHNEGLQSVLLKLRIPRTCTAFISGGLLALSGTLIQLLLQNPLADPYVLGISGGAALCTLLLMLMQAPEEILFAGAFIGSLMTICLILLMVRKHRWHAHSLLLSGIALACGFSALNSFILLTSPESSLHSMLFWLTGDLGGARFAPFSLFVLIGGLLLCLMLSPGFNILARGETEAKSLGLAVKRYRILLYVLSALFTATAVSLSGCIGFIGLIIL